MPKNYVTDLKITQDNGNGVLQGTFMAKEILHQFTYFWMEGYPRATIHVRQRIVPRVHWRKEFWRPGCTKDVKLEALGLICNLPEFKRAKELP